MTHVRCLKCAGIWDAAAQPVCPPCLTADLLSDPDLLRGKHDPANLPSSQRGYRSVVSFEFVQNPPEFLGYACSSGHWYTNLEPQHSGKPFLFNSGPYSSFPGSGIPDRTPMPTRGLDGLLIADPLRDPHVYADDPARISAGEARGSFVRISTCAAPACPNLAYPTESFCVTHRSPPLAVEHPHGT